MSEQPSATAGKGKGGAWQWFSDFMIGGTLGAVSKTIMAPVERVKLLQQTNESNPRVISGEFPPYQGTVSTFKRVYAEQGFWSYWRGNWVNVLRYGPQQGSALAFNDAIYALFPKYDAKTQFWESVSVKLLSGGLSGAIANTICYPFDFARTRLASDVAPGQGQFKSISDCIITTVKSQGITGLYTGWGVTVAGAFVYRAGQLGLFRQIQDSNPYKTDKGTLGAVSSFAAVTVARSVVIPFNYPFDTVRRCMMLQSEKPISERQYKSAFHCAREIVRKQGITRLYKGVVPELFRGVGGSLVIVAYERIQVVWGT